jgi:AcrR family transcriptional regulator
LKSKAAYHHGNLKPALIAAALREVAEEGPDGFSLRGVARRAGVSAPAVYRHFADKEALLVAMAADCSERLAATMIAAVAVVPPDDPLEQFRATGIALVQFAVAHPEHYRALGIPGLDARMPADLRAQQHAWFAEQRRSLLAAQAAGKIVDLPLDQILLCASTAMNGLAQAIVSGRLGPVDADRATELANQVTQALGVGFYPRKHEVHDARTKSVVRPRPSAARPRRR